MLDVPGAERGLGAADEEALPPLGVVRQPEDEGDGAAGLDPGVRSQVEQHGLSKEIWSRVDQIGEIGGRRSLLRLRWGEKANNAMAISLSTATSSRVARDARIAAKISACLCVED